MITGTVTDREPVIQLTVRGPGGEREIEAVVDTGFDRFLTLPADAISALGLKQFRQGRALLADGSEIAFDVYEATVSWDGATRRIPVDEADTTPLVGMGLLEGNELRVQVREGGRVAIAALPEP